MQIKSIAECSEGRILQCSWLSFSPSFLWGFSAFSATKYQNMEKPLKHQRRLGLTFIKLPLSLRYLFCLFLSDRFTQVLLYMLFPLQLSRKGKQTIESNHMPQFHCFTIFTTEGFVVSTFRQSQPLVRQDAALHDTANYLCPKLRVSRGNRLQFLIILHFFLRRSFLS